MEEKIQLWETGRTPLYDESKNQPEPYITPFICKGAKTCMVICPGGGYEWVSEREAEPIALKFVGAGYHAVVLHYSVAPAAHYLCGGIKVDLDGQSSINRLYAIGECSCTGLHGGNRLASNSLIEAVVYADAAAKHALSVLDRYDYNEDIPEWNDDGTMNNEERVLITQSMKEVNQIMEAYVGIVRSNTRLIRAWNRLDILYEETERLFKRCKASRELCELRNMINIGYLITRQAMERKESRGLHYTIDYPHANAENK